MARKKGRKVRVVSAYTPPDLTGVELAGGEVTGGLIAEWAVYCKNCASFMIAVEHSTQYTQCECGSCMAWREDATTTGRLVLHMQGPNRIFFRKESDGRA